MTPTERREKGITGEGYRISYNIAQAIMRARGHLHPKDEIPTSDRSVIDVVRVAMTKAERLGRHDSREGEQGWMQRTFGVLERMAERAHKTVDYDEPEDPTAEPLSHKMAKAIRELRITPHVVRRSQDPKDNKK